LLQTTQPRVVPEDAAPMPVLPPELADGEELQ
jgi:hypothetical protein